jgi:ABC-2 type transport system permease protein
MLREPEVIFWVFAFPLLLALGLGIAFRDPPAEPVAIAVEQGPRRSAYFDALDAVTTSPRSCCGRTPRTTRCAAARWPSWWVEPRRGAGVVLRYDPSRPEGRTARAITDAALQAGAGADRPVRCGSRRCGSAARATSTG